MRVSGAVVEKSAQTRAMTIRILADAAVEADACYSPMWPLYLPPSSPPQRGSEGGNGRGGGARAMEGGAHKTHAVGSARNGQGRSGRAGARLGQRPVSGGQGRGAKVGCGGAVQPLNCPLRHCRRARGWYRAAVLVGAPRKNRSGPRGAGGARPAAAAKGEIPWQCPRERVQGGGRGRGGPGPSLVLRVSYRQTGLAPSVRIKFLKLIMGLCGGLRGPRTTGRGGQPPRAQTTHARAHNSSSSATSARQKNAQL